jgi:hypothetical protein
MQPSVKAERPPYIRFELRAVPDRSGAAEFRDVEMVLITPQGSRDCVERLVTDWFEANKKAVREGRLPAEWNTAFHEAYRLWKDGQEVPINGFALSGWPAISPAMLKTCNALGMRAVEDVAAMNEESIARLGMGGRALKERAIAFLDTLKGSHATSKELDALRVQLKAAIERNTALEDQVKTLAATLEQVSAKLGAK